MIRLVFISTLAYNHFFPGKVKQAGGHTILYNLAKEFALLPEYDVFIITGDFGQDDYVKKEGVTLVKAPIDNPLALINVSLKIKRLKPDVLVDLCASPRLFLYYLLKKSIGLKYVFLTGSDNDVNGEYKKTENHLFYYFYIAGLKKADRVVSQVPHHKDLLLKRYTINSDLILSPYLKIKKAEKPSASIILWVGRAAHYKRPELFIQLAECFPLEKFVMICNKSSYDNGFMERINNGGNLPDNVDFHEYVPYPEMDSFYKNARFLVNTSDFEGFAVTFIEAAVSQTPILSLNSNPNNMLSEHEGGYVCNGYIEKLHERCQYMIQNSEETIKTGQKAFDYAFKYHDITSAVNQFDRIFKSIVKIKNDNVPTIMSS